MKSFLDHCRPVALALTALGLLGASGASAAASCDRDCLKGEMDKYLAALVKHDSSLLSLAEGYKSIYNGKPSKLDTDDWKHIDKIDFHQYVMDPSTGNVALFGVAVENYKRGTLFVRLEVKDGKLAMIETILGDRIPDGVPGLISPNPFYDYVLPKPERRSRKELIAIADSYFEGLETHDGSKVPVSHDCRRFEDGVQTSLNPVMLPLPCNVFTPFTYMDKISNRLYPIVDVERGLVLGQMVIEVSQAAGPPSGQNSPASSRPPINPASGMIMPPSELRGKPRHTIIHELFKVVDGKITEIQTIRMDRPYGWGGGW